MLEPKFQARPMAKECIKHPSLGEGLVRLMKIIVERKYKLGYYTIGVMTVEGSSFRCNTLEAPILSFGHPSPVNGEGGLAQYGESPNWNIVAMESPKLYKQFLENIRSVKAKHPGCVAIPAGTYDVKMEMSSRFKSYRPYLLNVPGFAGIMIHEGNTRKDTSGCLLVGNNTQKGMVLSSKSTLKRLMDMIWAAEEDHEPIEISII